MSLATTNSHSADGSIAIASGLCLLFEGHCTYRMIELPAASKNLNVKASGVKERKKVSKKEKKAKEREEKRKIYKVFEIEHDCDYGALASADTQYTRK